jgi:glycosyltransferase involved in cell wall biosynthesis
MAEVSVIMPAYNVAAYVGPAIDSVLAQTEPDWELLVVDDGSTDGTAAIVEGYAARDRRVRPICQANGGISAARNRALRESSGRFVALLDSDDLWEPRYLEAQLAILRGHPDIDVVTGNGRFLGGRRSGELARPWPDARPHPTLRNMLEDETAVFIMSIFRRRVYDTIGGFDESLRTNEDYDFWLRAAAAGFRFRRNDEPLGRYRRRDDSMSASDVRMLTGIVRVLEKNRPLIAERPAELAILESQIAHFRRRALAEQAKASLATGDVGKAADYLSALAAQGGGFAVQVAGVLARWTPGLFFRVYRIRRARQEAAL